MEGQMAALGVNWVGVVVATVVTFGLGALWYSPVLFAKAWMAAHGYTAEQVQAMRRTAGRAYAVTFLCWLLMATAVGILLRQISIESAVTGFKVGLLAWVGFAVPVGLSSHVFSQRRFAAFAIDAGYQLVSLLIMGLVLAALG
jgi:hypothetical protein